MKLTAAAQYGLVKSVLKESVHQESWMSVMELPRNTGKGGYISQRLLLMRCYGQGKISLLRKRVERIRSFSINGGIMSSISSSVLILYMVAYGG